ncbi:hypothetical protein [Aquibacillus rhizosphaerae]|uniref:Uncharacterized protein n=1 Tax=Aquibacillus rhizosphaerae TaxID=3051431 RepID=A0ABT7L0I6_9BACI|nr:hypothetical protein [Aquibacillus sp. LR5S19]MDL4839295.1 hypothetical protein [Aquibacillus sp. LR5S19]
MNLKNPLTSKVFLVVLSFVFLFTMVAPSVGASNSTSVDQSELEKIEELKNELEKHNISEEDILTGLQEEFEKVTPKNKSVSDVSLNNDIVIEPQGVKSKSAAIAAKAMIKKLRGYGAYAWNSTVKEYINKLPIPSGAKTTLENYTKYQVVMDSLNVVINFQGDITSALTTQMKNIGVPGWLAGMASRAIVFILL